MLVNLNINPQKSFRFVKVFTNVVANKTDIKLKSGLEKTKESSKENRLTPKEIRNAAVKSDIRIHANRTPLDRFIDIMV